MSSSTQTNYTVLEKAFSESYSEEAAEVFNRIESAFTRANKSRLRSKLREFRNQGLEMTPAQRMMEGHSSKLLGDFMRAMYLPRPGSR